ncbi:MAG: hypothetical protein FJ151_00895, partial [Euryarchaeota archaeon]|nr:hypothetical protein [Euryarchaeota archaeon]
MGQLDLKGWIDGEIRRFVSEDEDNRLSRLDGSPMFEDPLVGFVAGDDPIFCSFKRIIGGFHLTPDEVAVRVAVEKGVPAPTADRLGVVSYVLPIARPTREENAGMRDAPSERWANTRLFGEQLSKKLEAHLVAELAKRGFFAIAPDLERSVYRWF